MQLDKEAIDEFKKLYLQEYSIKLTDDQAMNYGMRLIRLVKAVYRNGAFLMVKIKKTCEKNKIE